MESAIKGSVFEGPVTVKALAEYMGATEKTVRNRIKEHPRYEIVNNEVREKLEEKLLSLRENIEKISLSLREEKVEKILRFSLREKSREARYR